MGRFRRKGDSDKESRERYVGNFLVRPIPVSALDLNYMVVENLAVGGSIDGKAGFVLMGSVIFIEEKQNRLDVYIRGPLGDTIVKQYTLDGYITIYGDFGYGDI